MTKTFNADQIADALDNTSAKHAVAENIKITFGHFPTGKHKYGEQITCSMAEWHARRYAATFKLWPDIEDKVKLPAEVGAILATDETGHIRRRGQDVRAFTWLFFDSDSGQSSRGLYTALQQLNIAYFVTASSTSRYNGKPLKWHLILPLATPKYLAERDVEGVNVRATIKASSLWWAQINKHVGDALFALGGLHPEERDMTSGSFPRMAYVPHMPPDNVPRKISWCDGRLLDLDAFLQATEFDGDIEPPLVFTISPKQLSDLEGQTKDVNFEGGDDEGPTPNETVGSLVYRALDYFGLVGEQRDEHSYLAVCPWHENHTPTYNHDPRTPDTSVLVYTSGEDGDEVTGGFKCMHNGSGQPGECSQATAADVLRWARRHGCQLPNSNTWLNPYQDSSHAIDSATPSTSPSGSFATPPTSPLDVKGGMTALVNGNVDAKGITFPTEKRKSYGPSFPGTPKISAPIPIPQMNYVPHRLPDGEMEVIEVADDRLDEARDAAIRALAKHPNYYVVKSSLHDVIFPDALDQLGLQRKPWLRKAAAPDVTVELCKVSSWVQTRQNKRSREPVVSYTRPDRQIVAAVMAAGRFPGVRELRGIISTPVFRPRDFTLIQQQGFDQASGILYHTETRIPMVSPSPSREDCTAALAKLRYLFKDFPFDDPDQAFAVWLSFLFSRFTRYAAPGNQPGFCVSAGDAGSGKGKIIEALSIIADGEMPEIQQFIGDDAEVARILGALVKSKAGVVMFDNIARGLPLASPTLEAFHTGGKWGTREIGTSNSIRKGESWDDPLLGYNGNGLQTGGDMARRTLHIEINDRSGSPTQRKIDFDLTEECRRRRTELLSAALTLLCGFFTARRGGWDINLPAFHSFEAWTVNRKAVTWCGLPDPYLSIGKAEDDADSAALKYLVEHLLTLRSSMGLGENDALYPGRVVAFLAKDAGGMKRHPTTFEFFKDLGVDATNKSAPAALGALVKKYIGRVAVLDGVKWQITRSQRDSIGSPIKIKKVT